MNLFAAFSRRAPNRIFISIILGGLAGACYSFLIPLVLSVLRDSDGRFDTVSSPPTQLFLLEISNAPFALVFSAVCVFILIARTASQVMLTRVAIDVASEAAHEHVPAHRWRTDLGTRRHEARPS